MGDEMRVAIHQPHYWPWLGYLKKMKEADIFVYLDEAAYTKNGFINRNKIQIDGKDHWLTIPVLTIAYGINPMIIFESTLNIEGFGTERLVNICKKLNADTYLSGPSGRDYLDESKFANIKVEYMDWNPPTDLSALHHYLMGETEALEEEINAP